MQVTLSGDEQGKANKLHEIFLVINPKIVDFVLEGLVSSDQLKFVVNAWMHQIRGFRGLNIPIVCLYLMRRLASEGNYNIEEGSFAWNYWINAAQRLKNDDFLIDQLRVEDARELLDKAFRAGGTIRSVAILFWLYALQVDNGNSKKLTAILISRMLMPGQLNNILQIIANRRSIPEQDRFKYHSLSILMTHSSFAREDVKKGYITIDISGLIKSVSYVLNIGFNRIFEADETRTIRQQAFCTYPDIMREIGIGGTEPGALAAANKFFNADDSRNLLSQYFGLTAPHRPAGRSASRIRGTIRPKT